MKTRALLLLLLCAALIAVLAVILARPRVRWERPELPETSDECCEYACYEDPGCACRGCEPMTTIRPTFTSGSPESVTSRADNGTAWDPRLMGA